MNNIAAYIDQVADDPIAGLQVCKRLGIRYVVVRKLWTTNIAEVKDHLLLDFRNACAANGVDILAIESDEYVDRIPLVVSFFKCAFVIYKQAISQDKIVESVQFNYVPIQVYRPGAEKTSSRVKFLFDPAEIPIGKSQEYWNNDKFFGLVVCDRDQSGPKPIGFGAVGIKGILESVSNKWVILKPSLGRRYGSLDSRESIFVANYDLLKSSLKE